MHERVAFKNRDGLRLAGVLHRPEQPTNVGVVIVHGSTGSKDRERYLGLAAALTARGIATLRFDLGGSGESDGRPITVAGQVADLHAALEYLRGQGIVQLGVLGESLGGLVALQGFTPDLQALVLWAPVTAAKAKDAELTREQAQVLATQGHYIYIKDGREFTIPQEYITERETVDQVALLARVTVPTLIIHGTTDDVIPIQWSERALPLLPAGSHLERVQGAGHIVVSAYQAAFVEPTVAWFVERLIPAL